MPINKEINDCFWMTTSESVIKAMDIIKNTVSDKTALESNKNNVSTKTNSD